MSGAATEVIYRFDGSIDGVLTAVFDSFVRRECPVLLAGPSTALPLFYDSLYEVTTDKAKASRVWRKLGKSISRSARSALTTAFLTDNDEFPLQAFRFISRAVVSDRSIENDFSDESVLAVLRECRRVRGEAHRMLQFVRFQKASDGTYFAMVEPLFDVLPMIVSHFSDRFSDQPFIIYDHARDYGYYYDGAQARRMTLTTDGSHLNTGRLTDDMVDPQERLYRELWRTYFRATTIAERSNLRKQRQDMPLRYWKYLTEVN